MTIEINDNMVRNKIFNIKSRTGRILKIVREHYLRDDLFCGFEKCNKCVMNKRMKKLKCETKFNNLIENEIHIIVPDTNILLHQLHLFESEIFENVVILQTVVEELKSINFSIYKRVCDLILNPENSVFSFVNEHHIDTYVEGFKDESSNDRNDRAIRVATKWYHNHLSTFALKSILITNDIQNRDKALTEDIAAFTFKDYVNKHYKNKDEIIDRMSSIVSKEDLDNDIFDKNNQVNFPEHLSNFEIEMGFKTGKYVKGSFMMSRTNYTEADVSLYNDEQEMVFIKGLKNMNRAIHQDIVAIEIFPESEWLKPSSLLLEDENEIDSQDIILPKEADDLTTGKEINVAKNVLKTNIRKTGRVIGIVKRKWRPYTGHLQLPSKINNIAYNSNSSWYTFIPTDNRIPRIRIQLSKVTMESNLISDETETCNVDDETADSRRSKIIIVHIDSWPSKSRYPKGHYVKTLGRMDDKESQNEALLVEHDIRTCEYPEKALRCLPPMPWSINQTDMVMRKDFRDKLIVSIDPPGCTDVDDALHCQLLPDGNLEVGVHIADVTHFVKMNSELDLEARDRGTTVYLVDRRIEMLPGLLSGDLCSLLANRDRFAFSIVWLIDSGTGETLKTEFHKSVIRSSAKLTYEEAQLILDARNLIYPDEHSRKGRENDWQEACSKIAFSDDPELCDKTELVGNISDSVFGLLQISRLLKQKRLDRGALVLGSSEMKFLMDSETNEPLTLAVKQNYETNSLVEEMMLLANISVATALYNDPRLKQWAVLRRHQSPPLSNFDPLIKAANTLNIKLDIDSGKALADSLDRAERIGNLAAAGGDERQDATSLRIETKINDESTTGVEDKEGEPFFMETAKTPYLVTLLRVLTARCMMEALYFCSGTLPYKQFFHYGLATDIYTHFTSPIRRYADVMVHRLLAILIGFEDLSVQMQDKITIQNVCNHLNLRNRNARNAQRASVELQIQLYFKNKIIDEEAYVIGIRKNALRVLVPKFGLEGSIYLKSNSFNENDILRNLTYDENESVMRYVPKDEDPSNPSKSILIKCFDKVNVRLTLLYNSSSTGSINKAANRAFNSNKLTIRLTQPLIPGFEPLNIIPDPKLSVQNNNEMASKATTATSLKDRNASAKKLKR